MLPNADVIQTVRRLSKHNDTITYVSALCRPHAFIIGDNNPGTGCV
ncbi:hypothetical protein BN2497_13119 [Janthinobacterium sp. CG23_2]|nr:hypothetical protein BN2497_13119 [Janthinobacterium sp. CG23_2]CUU32957.1 hypothetical protein BN3177_13119 [Janthinobacterium sp. CG23_2]